MPQRPSHSLIGTPFIELQTVDSTNNYALTQIHAGLALAGTAIFAHHQSAGRGQRGRPWSSENSKSLSLSLIINPAPLDTTRQFWLSACIAVTVCRLATKLTGHQFNIKWPNDLYWQDRKAGGILVESIVGPDPNGETRWKWAVAGIGLNINQSGFPGELTNAVSFFQVNGVELKIIDLAREICLEIDLALEKMKEEGFNRIYTEFNDLLYKKNQIVRLRKDSRTFEGLIKGVSHTGELIVEHGVEQHYAVGEIQLVLT
ncbi:MAG: biotin--[acetyl-CoA-carboxylase] ligase [Chitinophagaceae bacterium]